MQTPFGGGGHRRGFGFGGLGFREHGFGGHDHHHDTGADAHMGPPPPPRPPHPWGGGFGPDFGGPGFGGGPPFGFGPGPARLRGRLQGRGRGRGKRGDVRTAILILLTERSMHGYEMIQEIAERSGGYWKPSPGSVYPTLQLLADEGLITASESAGSKRLFELTEDGRAAAEKSGTPPWEQIADEVDPNEVNLRAAIGQLMGAVFQVSHAATPAQQTRAVEIVNEARRQIYAILGEVEPTEDDSDD